MSNNNKKKWQNNSQNGQILQDDKRVRVSASRLEKKRKRTATRHRKHVRRKSITTSSFFGTRVGGRKGRNTAKRASTKQQKISLTPSTSKRAGDLSFKIFSQRIYLEGGGNKAHCDAPALRCYISLLYTGTYIPHDAGRWLESSTHLGDTTNGRLIATGAASPHKTPMPWKQAHRAS